MWLGESGWVSSGTLPGAAATQTPSAAKQTANAYRNRCPNGRGAGVIPGEKTEMQAGDHAVDAESSLKGMQSDHAPQRPCGRPRICS